MRDKFRSTEHGCAFFEIRLNCSAVVLRRGDYMVTCVDQLQTVVKVMWLRLMVKSVVGDRLPITLLGVN